MGSPKEPNSKPHMPKLKNFTSKLRNFFAKSKIENSLKQIKADNDNRISCDTDKGSDDKTENECSKSDYVHNKVESVHKKTENEHDVKETIHNKTETDHNKTENVNNKTDNLHHKTEIEHNVKATVHNVKETVHSKTQTVYNKAENEHDKGDKLLTNSNVFFFPKLDFSKLISNSANETSERDDLSNDTEENDSESDEINDAFVTVKLTAVKTKNNSQSSQDSGFDDSAFASLRIADPVVDIRDRDVADNFQTLTLNNDKIEQLSCTSNGCDKAEDKELKSEKKRLLKTLYISRKPIRSHNSRLGAERAAPYPQEITQINEKIFSGGQLIVVSEPTFEEPTFEEPTFEEQTFEEPTFEEPTFGEPTFEELKFEEPTAPETSFPQTVPELTSTDLIRYNNIRQSLEVSTSEYYTTQQLNAPLELEGFFKILNDKISQDAYNELVDYAKDELPNFDSEFEMNLRTQQTTCPAMITYEKDQFLTPPRSNESIRSPKTYESPYTPPYYAESSYAHSSPVSDLSQCISPRSASALEETYDFTTIGNEVSDIPQIILDNVCEEKRDNGKLLRRSSINMSAIKKRLGSMSEQFASKDCCNKLRRSPKDEMGAFLDECTTEQRRAMCLNVADVDLDKIFDVLYFRILRALEAPAGAADAVNYTLFNLLCQRLLAEKPELFLHQAFGLPLLANAAMRCNVRPLLTRYLVWCIRCALQARPQATGPVFTQTDKEGDNLCGALVRRGDACADCLAEIVTRRPTDAPLFHLEHRNTEGYTPLHLACRMHNAATLPALHTTHVLIAHGELAVTLKDNKAGNTPLHCAVESSGCDLDLILAVYHNLQKSQWKPLAQCKNASQVTPLDLARIASKSTSRPDYPKEVFDFLKRAART